MNNRLEKTISTKQLCSEYNWYTGIFPQLIQNACDEFFYPNFETHFIGLSKNINFLIKNEACFVTKVMIDKEYDVLVRINEEAVNILLTGSLGQKRAVFNINKLSDLEVKIITKFNAYIFGKVKPLLAYDMNTTELVHKNFDTVHLTFAINSIHDNVIKNGKFVITLPLPLIKPESVPEGTNKFSEENFPTVCTTADAIIGRMKFPLYDIQRLEYGDIVIFENSDIQNISIRLQDTVMPVKLSPNMDLLETDEENNGEGENVKMSDKKKNIWDSIEVDMIAEVDSIKIPLGELKKIETGLVIDLASLYENRVTLKVDGNIIADGDLVIVNDRYGVKIQNIYTDGSMQKSSDNDADNYSEENDNSENMEEFEENQEASEEENADNSEQEQKAGGSEEEEFDYSDFEIDDDNI